MSEMRRRKLFSLSRAESGSGWRLARTAALILFSAMLGVAGVKAAEGWQQAEERQLAIARAEIAAHLADAKVDIVERLLDDRLAQAKAGGITPTDLAMAELEAAQARIDARTARLNLQEIEAVGDGPNDELYAPRIGGRDFVTERLELQRQLSDQRLDAAYAFLKDAEQRLDGGTGSRRDLASAQEQMAWARHDQHQVRKRLELRRDFLEEGVEPAQVEALSRLEDARLEFQQAAERLEAAWGWVEETARQFEAGTASKLDLRHAEYELLEIEAAHRLALLELQFLERRARPD